MTRTIMRKSTLLFLSFKKQYKNNTKTIYSNIYANLHL